jgi:hypothetical protein
MVVETGINKFFDDTYLEDFFFANLLNASIYVKD